MSNAVAERADACLTLAHEERWQTRAHAAVSEDKGARVEMEDVWVAQPDVHANSEGGAPEERRDACDDRYACCGTVTTSDCCTLACDPYFCPSSCHFS